MGRKFGFAALIIFGLACSATAEQPDLRVGEITFPSLQWGDQTAVMDVVNNTGRPKYVVVESEVQFTGAYLNPNRRTRTNFILPPGETINAEAAVLIPGNFGTAFLTVTLYDVVDTMDILLPAQQFYTQPFTLKFHVPDSLAGYLDERITLPPRVEDHPYFDNEFSRVLIQLLSEGRTAKQIAELADCGLPFVQSSIDLLKGEAYGHYVGDSFQLTIPFISVAEAEAAAAISSRLADTLTSLITANFPRFAEVRDSLTTAGKMLPDSNAFFHGGASLYHPYPVIGGLVLWWNLGGDFITRSAPFILFDGTDPCNANIPTFMYAVQGGPALNGEQYYNFMIKGSSYVIAFGNKIPEIECAPDFMLYKRLPTGLHWAYEKGDMPYNFMMDSLTVMPIVEAMSAGADPLLVSTYNELKELAISYGHPKLDYGYRYWFWNLTATRALKNLVANGVVTETGTGQYQFSGIEF